MLAKSLLPLFDSQGALAANSVVGYLNIMGAISASSRREENNPCPLGIPYEWESGFAKGKRGQ